MDRVEVNEFKFIISQKEYNECFRGIFCKMGIFSAIFLLTFMFVVECFCPFNESINIPNSGLVIDIILYPDVILIAYLCVVLLVSGWVLIKFIVMFRRCKNYLIKSEQDMKIIFYKDRLFYQKSSEFILKYSYKNILKYNFNDQRRELTMLVGSAFYRFDLSYISKEEREFIREQLKQCDEQIKKIENIKKFYGSIR